MVFQSNLDKIPTVFYITIIVLKSTAWNLDNDAFVRLKRRNRISFEFKTTIRVVSYIWKRRHRCFFTFKNDNNDAFLRLKTDDTDAFFHLINDDTESPLLWKSDDIEYVLRLKATIPSLSYVQKRTKQRYRRKNRKSSVVFG